MVGKALDVIVCDFETHGIEPRPNYPPKPVSLALKWPGQREYKLMAWGHGDGSKAFGNTCTENEARSAYKQAHDSRYPMLFQNGGFDEDVAETHWDIPLLPWERYHDTMFLLFLWDPHSPSLSLKPCAERYLGVKPEEQDRMNEWILANIPAAHQKPSTAGVYIWRCPYQIVQPYHKGDLTRTLGLFNLLQPKVVDAGMGEAYDRERRLMPILLRNARQGMRVDIASLEHDIPLLQAGMVKADTWLQKRLGDINLNSDKQLGDALYDKGIVTNFKLTPKGQRGVGKKHLTIDRFNDKKVYQVLTYKSQLSTCLGTFMEPWLELAGSGDVIHPSWSQVRSAKGDTKDSKGARSGRIICSKPNLLNLPKKWAKSKGLGYVHPMWLKVPELPFIRTYALPSKGKRWGRRDLNQQELRLFGFFEEGPVMDGFLSDPNYDIHEIVRAEIERQLREAGLRDSFERDLAKGVVFARLYGQGITGLMELLKLSEDERPIAQLVQRALNAAIPSIKELDNALKDLSRTGAPIKTWGGRLYYVEEPKYVEKFNRNMTFEYKLTNYLCQGSGADVTKEILCRYDEHPKRRESFITSVYDEIDINLPMSDKGTRQEMNVLKECMLSIDVKPMEMKSNGEVGSTWGTLKPWSD